MSFAKSNKNRILELDVLRGISALAVMFYHYTARYNQLFNPSHKMPLDFTCGLYGVGLFFIISGFVIFMTLENTKKPMDFIVSRVSRLYPCYWTSIAITFLIVHFFASSIIQNVTLKEALINFSMVQSWFRVPHVDGVYWTLTVELSLYFFIFMIFLFGQLQHIEKLGVIWLMIMIVNKQFIWSRSIHIPTALDTTQLLLYGHLFFVGIIFYNIKVHGITWFRNICIFLCIIVQFMIKDMLPQAPQATFWLIVSVVIFYLFIFNKLTWLANNKLVFLGTISYSLYLTHEYVGYIIIHHLSQLNLAPVLCLAVALLAAIFIATTITFGVEQPAIYFIRQGYQRIKEKRAGI